MIKEEICVICNKKFITNVHNKKICSKECKNKYRVIWNKEWNEKRYKHRKSICVICGKKFQLPRYSSAITCSIECRKENDKKRGAKYRIKNQKQIKISSKKFRESDKRKQWLEKNKEKLRKWKNKYYQEKRKNDLNYKLKCDLTRMILRILKENKHYHTYDYLDYTIEDLKKHIESQWKEGMNWKNHSRKGWHIDHKRPLVSFNFINKDGTVNMNEVKQALSLKNLQPLWARENISKGAKYNLCTNTL